MCTYSMRISAKADYAVRAALELAAASDPPVKGERLAEAQSIPLKFLENILGDLRQAGLVVSQRGPDGGYRLERSGAEISVADIIRAVDGPLASVRGERPESMHYAGPADHLAPVWIALRASVRGVLEHVTLQDIVDGKIPREVAQMASDPDAARRR
jgi:Rrf2 family protein